MREPISGNEGPSGAQLLMVLRDSLPLPTLLFSSSGQVLWSSASVDLDEVLISDIYVRVCYAEAVGRTAFTFLNARNAADEPSSIRVLAQRTAEGGWLVQYAETGQLLDTKEAITQHSSAFRKMIAVFSHELRNPLAALRMQLELLAKRLRGQETSQALTARSLKSVDTLERLLGDVADYQQFADGAFSMSPQPVLLAELLREATEHWRARSGRELKLELAPGTQAHHLQADGVRLRQLFDNLLDNALKFSEPHTPVLIQYGLDADSAVVRIIDQGRGLTPAAFRTLEQPFSQAAQKLGRTEGGLGLGTFIVRRIAEHHGATVHYQSQGEGMGTTVMVILPPAPRPAEPAAPRREAAPAAQPGPAFRRVLVVEDDEGLAEAYLDYFSELPHLSVDLARTGAEALSLAQLRPYELVIADLGLTDMSGYDVARELLKFFEGRPAPVLVAISGYASASDRLRSELAGFKAHFQKPLGVGQLNEILQGKF